MIFLFSSVFKFPVARVNCFSPLGHSGHPKLQAVVGSIEIEEGFPQVIGFFNSLESKKLEYSLLLFHTFLKVCFFRIALLSDLLENTL